MEPSLFPFPESSALVGNSGLTASTRETALTTYPKLCLHDLIQAGAEQSPARIAVRFEDGVLTYADLVGRANQLAGYLRSRDIGVGKLVGICVERSLEMVVGLLGILKTGAAYVPLDPAYPRERNRSILEHARICQLVSQQSLSEAISSYQGDVFYLDTDWHEAVRFSKQPFDSGATLADRAYVIFTSGSTGQPKGVQIPHRSVVNLLNCMLRELNVCSDDILPALASFAFDMCIPELYLPLIAGGSVVIAHRELASDGERLWQLIQNQQATIMQATPTTWALLLNAGFRNQGMRMICGAEPLPLDGCKQLLKRTDLLYNFYGPTETTVWSTFDAVHLPLDQVTIGRPLDNTQVYVVDDELQPVLTGEVGELLIAGDGLAIGYLYQPDLTAERFIPNPFSPRPGERVYRTRDLGKLLPDGRIVFEGRSDHQVKIDGFRIELEEVEGALRAHPRVFDAVVNVYERNEHKSLVAYVAGEHIVADELRNSLAQRLPNYMIPSTFVLLAELPRLPNGKVNRNLMTPPDVATSSLSNPQAGPRNSTERFLLAIWEEVLKVGQIGISDDFFRLGAHSLLVTQVASRIRTALGIELPLKTIFESRTVVKLAAEVDRIKHESTQLNLPSDADTISRGRLSARSLAARLDEMSETEIDALLAEFPRQGWYE